MLQTQRRGALHIHLVFWGSLPPPVLSICAAIPVLHSAARRVIDSQFTAELPRNIHVANLLNSYCKAERKKAPSTAELQPPLPPHALTDTSISSYSCKACLVVSEFGVHNHSISCAKKPKGSEGCRFFKPVATIEETTAALVTKGAPVTAASIEYVLAERSLPPTIPEGSAIVWELRRPRFELPNDPVAASAAERFNRLRSIADAALLESQESMDRIADPATSKNVLSLRARLEQLHLSRSFINSLDEAAGAVMYDMLVNQLATRNGSIVEFNDVLSAVSACNTACCLLGSQQQSVAALFYLAKYMTKDSVSLGMPSSCRRDHCFFFQVNHCC